MEPWKTYFGNTLGCIFFFTQDFINNGMLNNVYKQTAETLANLPLSGSKEIVAENFSIYDNEAELKALFYRKIKDEVFRLDTAEYFFNTRIFYNSTLSQLQAVDYVISDNVLGLTTHVDTLELTDVNGSDFLNFIL